MVSTINVNLYPPDGRKAAKGAPSRRRKILHQGLLATRPLPCELIRPDYPDLAYGMTYKEWLLTEEEARNKLVRITGHEDWALGLDMPPMQQFMEIPVQIGQGGQWRHG